MKAAHTLAAINAAYEADEEKEFRTHLGASQLGKDCAYEIFLGFRWAAREHKEGRMLRLLERGQLEEERFCGFLTRIGCEVWPTDPRTGLQWRVSFGDGHGGGSADGLARGLPDLPPGTVFLPEMKTHKESSFLDLEKKGLCQSKATHFAQLQIYTVKLQAPWGLYMAVNKNTDHLYLELVHPNVTFVDTLMEKADRIIWATTPPPRMTKKPHTNFYCKSWCKMAGVCWKGQAPLINCRTCAYVRPVSGGQWVCTAYNNYVLDKAFQHRGCASYVVNPIFNNPL